MKFNAVAAAVGAALLAGSAYADDAQKVIKDEASAAEPVPTPTFTVSSLFPTPPPLAHQTSIAPFLDALHADFFSHSLRS